jgi:hypothetical protein
VCLYLDQSHVEADEQAGFDSGEHDMEATHDAVEFQPRLLIPSDDEREDERIVALARQALRGIKLSIRTQRRYGLWSRTRDELADVVQRIALALAILPLFLGLVALASLLGLR